MKKRSFRRFLGEGIEGLLVSGASLLTWPVSKRWLKDWGSRRAERDRSWFGDQFVSEAKHVYTRAIDIRAPAGFVWPWLVQFGFGRAGFYSYELLERLVGIPVTNVESIQPAMQNLAVGDKVFLHPKAPGIPVASVEPNRRLCFGDPEGAKSTESGNDPARSWSMYLEPNPHRGCRLILRGVEARKQETWWRRVLGSLEQSIDFVMEQRMLRTVKRLAEQA
ncbi:MAG: hypothetical protein HKN21_01705 [Candidatus Eisenbacteria bacterium]|uniref:SRPBCC family protein n=1 Tax=Eiseniibacteriota bacterium TaxID=2212470 RepID=A0A7Y2H1A8_UNCEI|nr:hypothetical protein [Candidatus Eisenbacteria bacterium]